jgi:hypothetical protein
MNEPSNPEDRLLSIAEREMVAQTRSPGIASRSKDELQALGKRLREARGRARRIARQQSREISGKARPRGATAARDNTGSEAKAEVLVDALRRVTGALRKLTAPTQAELTRKAVARKRAAPTTRYPEAGRTATKGMAPKANSGPSVKTDPREIGRVSQAVKVAQRKRDR